MTPIDLVVVACCIAADVVTGLVSAWVTHSFESGRMREGAGHKLGELFALGLTYGLQYGLPLVGVATSINFVRFFIVNRHLLLCLILVICMEHRQDLSLCRHSF